MSKKAKNLKNIYVLLGTILLVVFSIVSIVLFRDTLGYELSKGTIYEIQVKSDVSNQRVEDISNDIVARSNLQTLEENYVRIYFNEVVSKDNLGESFKDVIVENSEIRYFESTSVSDSNIVRSILIILVLSSIFVVAAFVYHKSDMTRTERLAIAKSIFLKGIIMSLLLAGMLFFLSGMDLLDIGFAGVQYAFVLLVIYMVFQIVTYFDLTQNLLDFTGNTTQKISEYYSLNQKMWIFAYVSTVCLASTVFIFTTINTQMLMVLGIYFVIIAILDLYFIQSKIFEIYTDFLNKFRIFKKGKFWSKSN